MTVGRSYVDDCSSPSLLWLRLDFVPSSVGAVEESAYVHYYEGTAVRVARRLTESATG